MAQTDALDVIVKFLKEKKGPQTLPNITKHTQVTFDEALIAEIRSCAKLDYDESRHTVSYKLWLQDLDAIIKFLEMKRGPQTFMTIRQYAKVNPDDLEKQIEASPRLSYDPKEFTLCYRPRLDASNQQSLLRCLQEQRGGVPLADIADCYIGVQDDLDDLIARNDVTSIYNPDSKSFVIFPRDQSEELQLAMPDKMRALWAEVIMPNNKNDLDRKLMSMGHLPKEGERAVVGLVATQRQRKQPTNIKRRRTTLTNTHLLESMPWLKPT